MVSNLENPDYMAVRLNDKTDQEELSFSMDPLFLPREIELQSGVDRVLASFRKIIKLQGQPKHCIRLGANDN